MTLVFVVKIVCLIFLASRQSGASPSKIKVGESLSTLYLNAWIGSRLTLKFLTVVTMDIMTSNFLVPLRVPNLKTMFIANLQQTSRDGNFIKLCLYCTEVSPDDHVEEHSIERRGLTLVFM